MLRSSPFRCSMKRGVLKNFVKFTWKHFYWSLIFNKVATACNFIQKETPVQVLFCEFCEIFKNIFFKEHLRTELLLKAPLNIIFPTFPFVFVSLIISQKNYVESVRNRSFSGPYWVQMWENTDQKNSEYRHFSRKESFIKWLFESCFMMLFYFWWWERVHQMKEFL